MFDVISFEALLVPTFVDILSSKIARKYYEEIIYPVADAIIRPIKDDLHSVFSSFGDVLKEAQNKAILDFEPFHSAAKKYIYEDLGVEDFVDDMKKFVDGMMEHFFVDNKNTRKLLGDIAYILQYDTKNAYKLSKVSLEEYIALMFENDPVPTDMIDFYWNLSYDDWADHKLVTSGLRRYAVEFSKFMTVMENRAVERNFVCPAEARQMVNKGKVSFRFYGDYEDDHGEHHDKYDDYDDDKHKYDDYADDQWQYKYDDYADDHHKSDDYADDKHKYDDYADFQPKYDDYADDQHKYDDYADDKHKYDDYADDKHKYDDYADDQHRYDDYDDDTHKYDDYADDQHRYDDYDDDTHKYDDYDGDKQERKSKSFHHKFFFDKMIVHLNRSDLDQYNVFTQISAGHQIRFKS